jgi:hypothetical protein
MNPDIVINTCFVVFLIALIMGFKLKIIKNSTDTFLSCVGILSSFILLLSKTNDFIDVGHMLYCAVYLIGVTFFSYNKYLLLFNVIMLITIIISIEYYGFCILKDKQNDEGYFTELSYTLNLNWDYIFALLLLISFVKLFLGFL